MIHQLDFEGRDKVDKAIMRLKAYEPEEGYYLCFSGGKGQQREFERYPKFKNLYLVAFEKMLQNNKEKGVECSWTTVDEVYKWWVQDEQ